MMEFKILFKLMYRYTVRFNTYKKLSIFIVTLEKNSEICNLT
jgi:hypothetical protein